MEKTTQTIFSFNDFEIDSLKRKLLKSGQVIHLKPKTFDLLLTLVERSGEVLSKNDLLDLVWENQFVEENNLTVQIAALRKALGETRDERRFIVTVPGRGYRFVGELNAPRENEIVIESQKIQRIIVEEHEENQNATELDWVKHHRLLVGLTIAVLLLAIGVSGYVWRSNQKVNAFVAAPLQNLSLRKLTTSGNIEIAALSPDGRFYAYSSSQNEKTSLWLGYLDGGEPILLRPPAEVNYSSLNFAPDGRGLFYLIMDKEHPRGELYKIPLFGGAAEKLRDNINAPIAFAPNGRQFAFVRNDEKKDKSSLIIAELDNLAERELAIRPFNRHFISNSSPSWSSDGSLISVGTIVDDNTSAEVFTIRTTDGSVKPLTERRWKYVRSTAWLNDESGLVIVAEDKNVSDARFQLYQVSYPDGAVSLINPDLNNYSLTLNLSPESTTLFTVQQVTMSNIWTTPANDFNQAKQITFSSMGRNDGWYGLDSTPNGEIIYTAVTDKSETIWMMDSDGSNQKQIIPNDGVNLYPSITDDGRFIIFQSSRSGSFAIWRADADGGNLLQLTGEGIGGQPKVSPDGKWVVYISSAQEFGTLYRISIDGGEPLRLTDKRAKWVGISPDSRYVACGYETDNQTKLAIIPIEGGEPIQLFDLPPTANLRLGIRWRPDGQAVTYRDWINGIWEQELKNSTPERLTGLPHEKLHGYSWSRDGKQFVFTRGIDIRDIVLINNFR